MSLPDTSSLVVPTCLLPDLRRPLVEHCSCVLLTPSVVAPTEQNVVINPAHAHFARVTASIPRPLHWDDRLYDGYRNDQKVSELCTVSPSTLGITAADFDIARQAATFFQQLAPQNVDQMFSFGGAEQGYNGIPVRSVTSIGPNQITTEVTDVTHKAFADDSYAVPAGFQKQSFPGGRRGRQD